MFWKTWGVNFFSPETNTKYCWKTAEDTEVKRVHSAALKFKNTFFFQFIKRT